MSASGHADTVREALALVPLDEDRLYDRAIDALDALVAALEQAEDDRRADVAMMEQELRGAFARLADEREAREQAERDRDDAFGRGAEYQRQRADRNARRAVAAERRAADAEAFVQLIADRGCLFAGQPNCDCIRCQARAVLAGSQTTQPGTSE